MAHRQKRGAQAPNPTTKSHAPSVGSLFAGIGGFDYGFEQAGFTTRWQVEIDPVCRAVLADRFPHAQRFDDVCTVGGHCLPYVDVIIFGFPCQDVSAMGKRAGLAGARTGLFWEALRIIQELRPQWLVAENVVGLLSSADGRDFQTVIEALAACGYVGCWRVLDAAGFGIPQRRRRVFVVAGLGRQPPAGLLADAAPVDGLSSTLSAQCQSRPADGWAGYTLLAKDNGSRCSLGGENFVAHEGGWDQMAQRRRESEADGLCWGLDAANTAEARAAGNAVAAPVARWIATHLMGAMA